MQRRSLAFLFTCAAFLAAGSCRAAHYQVNVYDGYFDPDTLTVYAGDSVTFTNQSSSNPTNVHALNESFRCSAGCRGDGSNASGGPSTSAWADTLTFTTPGDIAYVSDVPVSEGGRGEPAAERQSGTIHVAVVPDGPAITPGFSGNWHDPRANQGGHGLQIEVLPDNGLLVIWFVFDPAGYAQNWIYLQGSYDPATNSAVLPAYLEQRGAFPPHFDASKLTVTPWGLLRLTFTDCDSGTADWTPFTVVGKMGYEATSFPIHRLTHIAGMSCP